MMVPPSFGSLLTRKWIPLIIVLSSSFLVLFFQVTPFYEAGSKGALEEMRTGIYRPAPVFGSLASVPSNALIFGSLLAVQRFTCKSVELVRGRQDPWNDLVGCLFAYPYYQTFLTKHVVLHNRIVGGSLLCAIAYANLSS
jgi:hypothetical protein